MRLHRLEHVLVLTDDLEETKAFYCDVLGFEAGARPQRAFASSSSTTRTASVSS